MNEINRFLRNGFSVIFFFFFLQTLTLFSQNDTTNDKKVVLDAVKINGIALVNVDLSEIAVESGDSLTILYHCDARKEDFVAFLFKINIKNEKDETFTTTNNTIVSYKDLPEGKYTLKIDAFSTQKKWKAEPIQIIFTVNEQLGQLFKKNLKLRDSLIKKEKKAVIEKKPEIEHAPKLSELLLEYFKEYYYLFIILVLIIVFPILYFHYRKPKQKQPPTIKRIVSMPDEKQVNAFKTQLDKLLVENSNLKAEISALRGQIDSLQSRTKDLYDQNKELKANIDKLSKSKHDLENLQEQKDDLFAVVIHDIKNPAALIKSLVELLRSYDLTASEQQDIINDIFETTKKIVSLSQEVTRILSLESTSIKLNLDKVDIRDVIKDVSKRNTLSANAKSINLIVDLADSMPETLIDYQKIDEVLDNLLSNAIKFSHTGGKVRVLAKVKEDNIVVEVSDNGLGLSEEDITLAFQRGIKLSAQPTGGEHSSGFGLWIVKKLVEAHKGRVWVKSALGRGSTFAFSIPMIFDLSEIED